MKLRIALFCLLLSLASFLSLAQNFPAAFLNISATLGRHNISFNDFSNSPGPSFGFKVSLGIYAINKNIYSGGLIFTLLEGASYDSERRQLSEDFILPNQDFDKHIIFKFAQFRSATIGWFNNLKVGNTELYHQIGFGIFGTTERDQLFDFSIHNELGVYLGKIDKFRLALGLTHDKTIGSGNPNYDMSNLGLIIGGIRTF